MIIERFSEFGENKDERSEREIVIAELNAAKTLVELYAANAKMVTLMSKENNKELAEELFDVFTKKGNEIISNM